MQNFCCFRPELDVPIYNFTPHKDNVCKWKDFMEVCLQRGKERPAYKAIWYYSLTTVRSASAFMFLSFLVHILPALLVDTVLVLINKKPK